MADRTAQERGSIHAETARFQTGGRQRAVPPMNCIPIGRTFVSDYEMRQLDSLTSGTYIENGDVLVAKITPCFENGKQAIVKIDRLSVFATTEVIPLKGVQG